MFAKKENVKAWISLAFTVGACNLGCEYCYLGQHSRKISEIPYSLEEIKKAFSYRRLGGACLVNVCSDGETLIHPRMPQIIKTLLEEGHYVMVVTNGTLKKSIEECLAIEEIFLKRLFFKVSFQYAELKKRNLIELVLENVEAIRKSPCSFTLEYVFDAQKADEIETVKQICEKRLGAVPHIAIPRDDRKYSRGILSKYSWDNYQKVWDEIGYESNFFAFKRQIFGKRYRGYCYAGERALWINMKTGYSYQCYGTPPLQNFMDCKKPVRWLAVGSHCPESHCYNCHALMAIGVAPYPESIKYKATYDEIRDRLCGDGGQWLKPAYRDIFKKGVFQKEHGRMKMKAVDFCNELLRWRRRRENN